MLFMSQKYNLHFGRKHKRYKYEYIKYGGTYLHTSYFLDRSRKLSLFEREHEIRKCME